MKVTCKFATMVVIFVLVLVTGIGYALAGTDSPAGSQGDPVVTKSYVDSKSAFSPISLTAGQKLIGGEGCEIILRSGEATAIDNGANGISDLTDGKDLITGNWVFLNHLLLVPRSDGRGIKATTDIWVMVKGEYSIY